MHSLPISISVAVSRILHDVTTVESTDLESEITTLVDKLRTNLRIGISELTLAVMWMQDVVQRCKQTLFDDIWKLVFLGCVSIGIKYMTDGFYLVDIIEYVTSEFSLCHLKWAENIVFEHHISLDMVSRHHTFRTALTLVVIERPLSRNRGSNTGQGIDMVLLSPLDVNFYSRKMYDLLPDLKIWKQQE